MNIYTTVAGDTWDYISYKVYGSEKYADHLMRNNYEKLDYFIFPANVEIKCPELPEEINSSMPSWRE